MKVAITTTSFGKYDKSPLQRLDEEGITYILNPLGRKMQEEELADFAKDTVGLIAGTENISRRVFERLSGVKVISRCGAGIDNVDLDAARAMGIKVYNTPHGPTLAVAELTVGLILNLLRKIGPMDRDLKDGIWNKMMGNLLSGKNVGILGFGRIGQKVAELLLSLGAEVSFCDVCNISCELRCSPRELEDLLRWADILSLHLSAQTEPGAVLGQREINQLKPGAWLVNTSRGGLVDEDALYSALKDGRLSGAAIDVFSAEPYTGPLASLDNVILTPHVGSYALEARVAMETQAVENLISGLRP